MIAASSPDWSGIAALVTAAAVLVVAVGGVVQNVKLGRKVEATHAMVRQVDAAVNGKPPGASTMVSQVQDIHDQLPPEANGESVLSLLRRIVTKLEADT